MTLKELEKVLYFECYIVTDAGETPLQYKNCSPSASIARRASNTRTASRPRWAPRPSALSSDSSHSTSWRKELRVEMKATASEARARKLPSALKVRQRVSRLRQQA